MRITGINNFSNFTSKYKSTFRDQELFDEQRDRVDNGYSSYDGYTTTFSDLIDNNTDFYYHNTYDFRFPEKKQLRDYVNLFGQVNNPLSIFEPNEEIYDLCIINGKNKIAGILYNDIVNNKTEKYSLDQIKRIVQSSKLYTADGQERIDYNLADLGFYCIDKFPNSKLEDIEDLMNSLVAKNKKGDEILIPEAKDFVYSLSDNYYSVRNCIKAIETGLVCDYNGRFQYFNSHDAFEVLKPDKL